MAVTFFVLGTATQALGITPSAPKTVPLDRVISPRVVVTQPGPMTPVQPYAQLEFEAESCAEMPLTAKVLQSGNRMRITVELPADYVECEALPTRRTYSLQISSDWNPNSQVTVTNSIPVTRNCDREVTAAFRKMAEDKGYQFNGVNRITPTEALIAILDSNILPEDKKAKARQQILSTQIRDYYNGVDNYMSGTGLTLLVVDPASCEVESDFNYYSE